MGFRVKDLGFSVQDLGFRLGGVAIQLSCVRGHRSPAQVWLEKLWILGCLYSYLEGHRDLVSRLIMVITWVIMRLIGVI